MHLITVILSAQGFLFRSRNNGGKSTKVAISFFYWLQKTKIKFMSNETWQVHVRSRELQSSKKIIELTRPPQPYSEVDSFATQ